MLKPWEFWVFSAWSIGVVCFFAAVVLRFRLVHVLSTKYPDLYLQLGSPAFFWELNYPGRKNLVAVLKGMPSSTLSNQERRVVEAIWVISIVGRVASLSIAALVLQQVMGK